MATFLLGFALGGATVYGILFVIHWLDLRSHGYMEGDNFLAAHEHWVSEIKECVGGIYRFYRYGPNKY